MEHGTGRLLDGAVERCGEIVVKGCAVLFNQRLVITGDRAGQDAGPRVLTGAIARDDEALVEQHRAALDDDLSAPLYRAVEEAARSMLQDDENPKS